jgi:2-phosphosulfolactate phosphatase
VVDAYRLEWGIEGLASLAPSSSVVVIVDVLRFSTAVCCALESGITVLPYPWLDANDNANANDSAGEFARAHGAVLAGRRERGELSLSPTDLLSAPAGTRLVLPSPNGSTLAFAARECGAAHVLAGCIRNASSVAEAARVLADGGPISIVAAGERWNTQDGPLRVAVEDLLGAGAILSALDPAGAVSAPRCSPEAAAARAAFVSSRPLIFDMLAASTSGRELVARGWSDDVATAAAHDVSTVVPMLAGQEFRPA